MLARLRRENRKLFQITIGTGLVLIALSLFGCSADDSAQDAEGGSAPGMTSSGNASGDTVAPSMGGVTTDGDFAGESGRDDSTFGGVSEELAATNPGGGTAPQPIADVLGRQVIRNGSMDLIVESVTDAFDQTRGIVEQAGGYLAGSSFSGREEDQRARLTARVPAERFDQVIADLRNLAIEVDSVSTSSQDVTEEYTDLEASLRNLRAVEQQYLTLLGDATNIGDILQVQDRLNSVRYELERVQGRMNLLDNQTSLATLEVALYPESAPMVADTGSGFTGEIEAAWQSSLDFVGAAGTSVVVALVWSWWLIPFVIVGALLLRRYGGRLTPDPEPERVDTPESAA